MALQLFITLGVIKALAECYTLNIPEQQFHRNNFK